jgi:UDP-N-acetylmuramoylalanine--D-glutamate ligase
MQKSLPTRPRALVVGLGATGISCVRFLVARGYDVRVADTRANPPKLAELTKSFPQVQTQFGKFAADGFAEADLLVVSPGVAVAEPAIQRALAAGVEVVGDVELFAREAKAPILAITGSNGKSTVTALTGEILRAAGLNAMVGGNIGVPVLEMLESPPPDFFVLELSSFQLETTLTLNARAAVILNISPDHMDRYDDLAAYVKAKARIYQGGGLVIANRADQGVLAAVPRGRRVVSFGLDAPPTETDFGLIERDGESWLAKGSTPIMRAAEVAIAGRHNLANALAACALTDSAGAAPEGMAAGIRGFRGLPHRSALVGEIGGVRFINDSKGTNVGATVAALDGQDAPVVLIAGGLAKGQAFDDLRDACRKHARAVVLIGQDAGQIEGALGGVVPVRHAASMEDAVRVARQSARPGDIVLLSPACASFDMFRDYQHRGDEFARVVRALN